MKKAESLWYEALVPVGSREGTSGTGRLVYPLSLLQRFYLFIFRERGREGKREGEKHQCVVASRMPLTGDLTHNPGMCPGWELNGRPFGSQARTQSTEPYQPGLDFSLDSQIPHCLAVVGLEEYLEILFCHPYCNVSSGLICIEVQGVF